MICLGCWFFVFFSGGVFDFVIWVECVYLLVVCWVIKMLDYYLFGRSDI